MSEPLPQALATSFVSRLKNEPSGLIMDTAQPQRSAKRHTQQINYAEFEDNAYDDERAAMMPSLNTNGTVVPPQQIYKDAKKAPIRGFSDAEIAHQADKPEFLVPIRLNIEYNSGNSKLVDFFMWNLNEALITPEIFGRILSHDLELTGTVQSEVVKSITQQIEDYQTIVASFNSAVSDDYDVHVIINLSVNLDKQLYEDKFEWDLTGDLTPEEFAGIVVNDLGISLQFKPAIAHALHENILRLKKEICEGNYNFDLANHAVFNLQSGLRIDLDNLNSNWQPSVETLTPWEIEKREIERERNFRRLKRENMRVGEDSYGRRRTGKRRYDELEGSWKIDTW